MAGGTWVIFLNGSHGVGKSSALDHLGDVLAEHGQAFCLVGVDWYHRSWPPAKDDLENVKTEAANMSAVWNNCRRTGLGNSSWPGSSRPNETVSAYERVSPYLCARSGLSQGLP